jgi:hypothetical protein
MTIPYSMRQQGWMFVDNGAPCLTEEQARAANLPLDYARRSVVEVDTLHCRHCGGCVIKNPDRVRPRGHCQKCNWFVCDPCAFKMSLSDYVHKTFLQKVDDAKTAGANFTCI